MSETDHADLRAALLDAAVMHVPFDGWSELTFQAAIRDAEIAPELARMVCPRGALDLALAYHAAGDQEMLRQMEAADLDSLRFRDRVAAAVRFRLEAVEDKELVRRGTTLFSLPHHAGDGAKAIWGTADAIWTALGDSSEDVNWYSKRATLSGVYSATVLFWLGDDSLEHQATWDFLERRIEDVMRFEKVKAEVQKNPLLKPFLAGPNWLASQIRKPGARDDLPGRQG
ncbi:COQ9 family protein [Epibacterium sp. SM1969]|uniref:COQ9 family protein n=1 Tax=Tritonibacter aquimaris TaxID=2663379 RepID=A0A844AWU4_9RHOB|nr:COQ9 family protein [Tritonibacter aquimaris]MQY42451.1 COQ9 family protein [Tritonibacter aquimaris]